MLKNRQTWKKITKKNQHVYNFNQKKKSNEIKALFTCPAVEVGVDIGLIVVGLGGVGGDR